MDVFDQIDALLSLPGATQTKLASRVGVSQATIARWVARNVSPEGKHRDRIRELYSEALVTEANASARQPAMTAPNASFPPRFSSFPDSTLPLLGQTVGGPNGRFILNGQEVGRVFCPPDLAGIEGAYAVQVYGTSMEPKFEAGETVWLHPWTPVRSGDYVVAQIFNGDADAPSSYIKQFVSKNSKILKLRQLNPEEGENKDIEFPAERVFSVHKIVFHALV